MPKRPTPPRNEPAPKTRAARVLDDAEIDRQVENCEWDGGQLEGRRPPTPRKPR